MVKKIFISFATSFDNLEKIEGGVDGII